MIGKINKSMTPMIGRALLSYFPLLKQRNEYMIAWKFAGSTTKTNEGAKIATINVARSTKTIAMPKPTSLSVLFNIEYGPASHWTQITNDKIAQAIEQSWFIKDIFKGDCISWPRLKKDATIETKEKSGITTKPIIKIWPSFKHKFRFKLDGLFSGKYVGKYNW